MRRFLPLPRCIFCRFWIALARAPFAKPQSFKAWTSKFPTAERRGAGEDSPEKGEPPRAMPRMPQKAAERNPQSGRKSKVA